MKQSDFIDLRSDTVTRPTPAMRRAMAEAEVGDDLYGDDPTMKRLESRAAEIIGKEAALFVPSGTMGNTIGIKLHTHHGEEVICEARSHVLDYEMAMLAWFSGCIARPIVAEDGILRWDQVRREIRVRVPYRASTGAVSLENTHNMMGGAVMPLEVMNEICDGAHGAGVKVHLDGARIFNAATFLGVPASALAARADTVMFCLSKGLCAPVGSILAGTGEDIARARLHCRRLGGSMRQSGVLAAAGLIALEEMSKRLAEDHENARLMAEGLNRIGGIRVTHRVQTNVVIFDISATGLTSAEFSVRLKQRGVLINGLDPARMRLLTHFDVCRAACEHALTVIEEVARG